MRADLFCMRRPLDMGNAARCCGPVSGHTLKTKNNATGERIAGPDPTRAELLSVNDVASLLSCSPRHVYRLTDGGKLPRPLKLGALVRWPRRAIEAWIADGCPSVRVVKGGAR